MDGHMSQRPKTSVELETLIDTLADEVEHQHMGQLSRRMMRGTVDSLRMFKECLFQETPVEWR